MLFIQHERIEKLGNRFESKLWQETIMTIWTDWRKIPKNTREIETQSKIQCWILRTMLLYYV